MQPRIGAQPLLDDLPGLALALALPLTAGLPDSQVANLEAPLSQFPGTLVVFAGLAALVLWRPV